jgi:hypothetical protein
MPWSDVAAAVSNLMSVGNQFLRESAAHEDISAALSSMRPRDALAFLLVCNGTTRRHFLPEVVAILPTISDRDMELLLEVAGSLSHDGLDDEVANLLPGVFAEGEALDFYRAVALVNYLHLRRSLKVLRDLARKSRDTEVREDVLETLEHLDATWT